MFEIVLKHMLSLRTIRRLCSVTMGIKSATFPSKKVFFTVITTVITTCKYSIIVSFSSSLSITFYLAVGLTALSFVLERKEGLLDRCWVSGERSKFTLILQCNTNTPLCPRSITTTVDSNYVQDLRLFFLNSL